VASVVSGPMVRSTSRSAARGWRVAREQAGPWPESGRTPISGSIAGLSIDARPG
jgi:hypothetical protein